MGIKTSFAHPKLKFVRFAEKETPVWPSPKGKDRGVSLTPIYKTLPEAALGDPGLYELASLVDMIRSDRAREKALAKNALHAFLKKGKI